MKMKFYLQVVLTLLSVFVAGLLLTGCGMGKSQAPATKQQAQKEAPAASPAAGGKAGAESPPSAAAPVISGAPKRGGTLTIGMRKEITTMNPQINTMSIDQSIRDLMFEPLLGTDKNTNMKPGLAERWEISPDGKEYTFYLRRNVKFHNGKTMTANDVKWTVDYVMDPRNAAYGSTSFEKVSSVEIIDANTIKFTLKTPFAAFLDTLASIKAFCVVPEGSLATGVDKLAGFPPGTGPFKFEEYKHGQYVAVTRFDDYWGQVPYLDRLILRSVPDENVRFAALRAGDLDISQETPFQWVKQVQTGEVKGITYTESALGQMRRIIFNVQRPPFDNIKVRQAVAYAIDKQQILDVAFWGFGSPINERLPKDSSWRLGVPDIKRDLNKARDLLKEAGYPDGLDVTLMTRQGTEKMDQTIQQQLAEAGIKVKIELLESSIETNRRRIGDFQFANSAFGAKFDPSDATQPDFMTEQGDKRAANYSGYSDPAMDALFKSMATETDFNKRKDLYRKVMEKVWNDVPELYVGTAPSIWAVKDHVKGFVANDKIEVFVYQGGGLNYTWIDK